MTNPARLIEEYLEEHGLDAIAVTNPVEVTQMNLSRREHRDNLVRWEMREGDPDAPPGMDGIVAHNIRMWAVGLWPDGYNVRDQVRLTSCEIESLLEMAGETQVCISHRMAYIALRRQAEARRTARAG